jgi:LPS biosynthesis protein
MKVIKIEELKKIQLDILTEIDTFCRKNNIKYFLGFGTLLGAIRHKGYIPWDDDIDIVMLRNDYDKFIKEFSKNDRSIYRVQSGDIDKTFLYPYAKIDDTRTTLIENANNSSNIGINIDLFPLDIIPEDSKKAKILLMKSKVWNCIYILKYVKIKHGRNIFKNIILILSHFLLGIIKYRTIKKNIIINAQKYKNYTSKYCGNVVMTDKWNGGIQEVESFSEVLYVDFETIKVPIPCGYDAFLKGCYGDYMELPPLSERVSHHSFYAYWK